MILDLWQESTDLEDHVSLIDWDVSWEGLPYTSQFVSCKLIVEGLVMRLRLREAPEAYHFRPPYLLVDDDKTDFSGHPIPWRCAGQLGDPNVPLFDGKMFTCLLIRSRISSYDGPWKHKEIFHVLESASEQGIEGYRRVGIARIQGKEPSFSLAERMRLRFF